MTWAKWHWCLSGMLSLLTVAMPLAVGAEVRQKLCPQPVLSRLVRHRIAPGETLQSLAQKYNLIPTTLMGFNPVLRQGQAPVGYEIVIPPYNGVQVAVPPGKSIKDIAATYGVRADVLFELNGCQTHPQTVFVPGVNWSPIAPASRGLAKASITGDRPNRYPLPAIASVITGYGWQVNPATRKVEFHPGLDLEANTGTPVLAMADGVVAFAGDRGSYGKLVVLNHPQGLQTRYAQLNTLSVTTGQSVQRGQQLGKVGATGNAAQPHLHFEVRQNSHLGWVAEDPTPYLNKAQGLSATSGR